MQITTLRRPLLGLIALAVAVSSVVMPAGAATAVVPAHATAHATAMAAKIPDRCVPGTTSSSGTCFKLLKTRYRIVRVESVPLRNKSSKTAEFTCTFTKKISRSIQKKAGISTTGEVNAVFGLAKASVSANLERSVTQTGEQATSVGVTVTLKPGQNGTCIRTYGHVVTKVKRYSFSGHKVTSKVLKTRIPSNLGVDFID